MSRWQREIALRRALLEGDGPPGVRDSAKGYYRGDLGPRPELTDESEDEEETEIGTDGDMGDSGAAGRGVGIKARCPECGKVSRVQLPSGVTVEVEDEEEAEGGMRTIRGTCSCEAEFEIAPPKGFAFVPNRFSRSDEDEDEDEDEAEDESQGDSRRGTDARRYGMGGTRKTGEAAIRTFRRSYEGRSDTADGASDALTCFREAYRHARRSGRDSAMPPQ